MDGRTPDHGHPISSPCEPNGSGELKIFSGTGGPISKKLGMKHRWLKNYNVYINHDPVVALTYFTTRST